MMRISPSPCSPSVNAWRLPELVRAALAACLPVAAWRSPLAASAQAVVHLSGPPQWAPLDLARAEPGFAFAPFLARPGHEALHLRADLWHDGQAVRPLSGHNAAAEEGMERLLDARADLRWTAPPRPCWPAGAGGAAGAAVRCLSQDEYCALVARGVSAIRQGHLQKVVLARVIAAPLPPALDPVSLFDRLAQRYPAAFVSLVAIPGVGIWLGATPELLLETDGRRLRTVALAGTQPLPPHGQAASVRWGAKELEEQALVTRYVGDFFRRQGVAPRQEGPHTVVAGHLAHLRTSFEVSLPPEPLARLATQVVQALHPTPAVCGLPREAAAAFILAHEPQPRDFYSGFLGPVALDGKTALYVNLRCLRWEPTRALLYVGAGITASSDPCAEWHETVLKARTLLSVLYDTAQAVPSLTPIPVAVREAVL